MAYKKPQNPLTNNGFGIYPLTTADQIILSDGSRLEKNGTIHANTTDNATHAASADTATDSEKLGGVVASSYKLKTDASVYKYTTTLSTSGWSSSAPYTQTVTVTGILATDTPIIDLNMSNATADTAADIQGGWACIGRIVTAENTITAYCYENIPKVALPLNILVVR